jgi:hypothetical protein
MNEEKGGKGYRIESIHVCSLQPVGEHYRKIDEKVLKLKKPEPFWNYLLLVIVYSSKTVEIIKTAYKN